MSASVRARELATAAAEAAADKLASDIIAIDVSSHLALSDVFVVASANNDRQLHAIVDNIMERLLEFGEKPLHREGEREGNWALLDYADIVVHVQLKETRQYYRLDRLWNDCPLLDLSDVTAAGSAAAGGIS